MVYNLVMDKREVLKERMFFSIQSYSKKLRSVVHLPNFKCFETRLAFGDVVQESTKKHFKTLKQAVDFLLKNIKLDEKLYMIECKGFTASIKQLQFATQMKVTQEFKDMSFSLQSTGHKSPKEALKYFIDEYLLKGGKHDN